MLSQSNVLRGMIVIMANGIWVFNGVRSNFPSALFYELNDAERWIQQNNLTGILTKYPVDISVYDWAINKRYFQPNNSNHLTPDFIGRFSSAYLEHYHYENGKRE